MTSIRRGTRTTLQDVQTNTADLGSDGFADTVADILGGGHAPFRIIEDLSTAPYWNGEFYMTHDVVIEVV